MNNLIWKPLKYPMIPEGYLISNTGFIRNKDCDESDYLTADYHSSNGYDYILLIVKEEYRVNNSIFMLFPIDELLASAFIHIPEELTNKRITVKHIDGDTRNIELTNLEWIEDIEEWRECTYPGVEPGVYDISSFGRIRNNITKSILRGSIDRDGYIRFSLNWKRSKNVSSHRLLAYQFLNIPVNFISENIPVNHINGIKTHNHWKNLEVISVKTNNIHALQMGLRHGIPGEKNHFAKQTNFEIENLCKCICDCKANLKLIIKLYYEKYGIKINEVLINNIIYKYAWVNISDKYFTRDDIRNWRHNQTYKSTTKAHEEPKLKVKRDAFKK